MSIFYTIGITVGETLLAPLAISISSRMFPLTSSTLDPGVFEEVYSMELQKLQGIRLKSSIHQFVTQRGLRKSVRGLQTIFSS
jgi:hypothetical protein